MTRCYRGGTKIVARNTQAALYCTLDVAYYLPGHSGIRTEDSAPSGVC